MTTTVAKKEYIKNWKYAITIRITEALTCRGGRIQKGGT
jgi:hypothetical protein